MKSNLTQYRSHRVYDDIKQTIARHFRRNPDTELDLGKRVKELSENVSKQILKTEPFIYSTI